MIYFVHGPDRLLTREAVLGIVGELDADGSNTNWLDGREVSFGNVATAVGAAPFFNSPRIVVVTDLLARTSRVSDSSGSTGDDAERPGRVRTEIASLVSAVPESHHLIFFEPNLSSVPAAFKHAAPGAKVIAGDPPRGAALLAWIEASAVQAESSIDRRAAQRLAEALYPQNWDRKPSNPRYDRPPDLALLKAEIGKLALAAYPGRITVDEVAMMTPGAPDQRVFQFLDAALAGDLRPGLDKLERLIASGEAPAMLLGQLLGQIELTTLAVAAGGKSPDSVTRDLGTVVAGRISAVMAATRRRAPRAAYPAAMGALADRNLKTGRVRNPEDALHDLVLALAAPGPTGSSG